MPLRRTLRLIAGITLLSGILLASFLTRAVWLPWVLPGAPGSNGAEKRDRASGAASESQQVRLTRQAQHNLRLVAKALRADTYWRTISVPGSIVDRPAFSDRGVVAPVTAVVTHVHRFPGDTVRPGDRLFTLRLLSETLHLTQADLFKTSKEIQINEDMKKRLSGLSQSGAVSEARMIEVDNQLRRLTVAALAYRTALLARGLTPDRIDGVAEGKFISEIEVKAPQLRLLESKLLAGSLGKALPASPAKAAVSFEVQELKVELGQQVEAGQTLCLLSNHQSLYIEGRAFRQESPLIEKAARKGWPIQVEFREGTASGWPALTAPFHIRHIANTIDTGSRTFSFFLPLDNQSRTFEKAGNTLLLWRFRPGQKVRLLIRVEKFENVFVLPADAVVREGPEAYVFRQNGDFFDRKAVRIVYQDRRHIILANDGSIPPGLFVAQNAATQLNRVLKAQSGSVPTGFHMHADGSMHSNSGH